MNKGFYTKELISEVLKECIVIETKEEEENDEEDNRDES